MTQDELRSLLSYEPLTGVFTWLKCGRSFRNGSRAGTQDDRYRFIRIGGKDYSEHRLAFIYMTGAYPAMIDHINRDVFDNRWANIKSTDSSGNHKNVSIRSDNQTGIAGIYLSKHGYWLAHVSTDDRVVQRRFNNLFEACAFRISFINSLGYSHDHGRPQESIENVTA